MGQKGTGSPHPGSGTLTLFLVDAEPGDAYPDLALPKKSLDPDSELTIPFLNKNM
jgi:hypothetical protein